MTKRVGENCIDIIEPYMAELATPGMPPAQLMGGVGSVALTHPHSIILPEDRRIDAPAGLKLSQYRPEGTLRDIETLVLSANPCEIDMVDAAARRTVGSKLVVETFALKPSDHVEAQVTKPLGKSATLAFVSDRYVDPDDHDLTGVEKSLFPFSAHVPTELLEPWSLHIDGRGFIVPVPPAGTVILNYLTRSISGARPKDAEKLETMATAVFEKAPETADWIVDGPGSEQFQLARILHTLREPRRDPRVLTIGGKLDLTAIPYDELRDHPAFLLRDEDSTTQARALRVARLKSRLLHGAEAHLGFLVGPFQKYVEPRIGSILHNDTK